MKISAVLLAGGESRRFGEDKATFVWEGQPLWKRQLATLQETGVEEIILSARTDPPWRPADVIFVPDSSPRCGPLGGLLASLGSMRGSHILALAIDMPFMTPRYLRLLIAKAKPGCGVLPILNERAEPLAAIYPVEATAVLQDARDKDRDFALRSLAQRLLEAGQLRSVAVQPDEEVLFQNFNHAVDARQGAAVFDRRP
jgi:molybdopterin-guanine dinucleotide biosynthesis protein A